MKFRFKIKEVKQKDISKVLSCKIQLALIRDYNSS